MSGKPEISIRTYAELRHTAAKFAQGEIPLMILIGTPGLGKTQILEEQTRGRPYLKVDGKKAPLDLFVDLHRHLDEPVVLDDVDGLLDNKDAQILIRQLTDTKPLKGVSWGTRTTILGTLNPPVPRYFQTRSVCCLIANRWRSTGIFAAIESRAMVFRFDPSWMEAYQYATSWFQDQEVLDYVHANLAHMRRPDLRLLQQAVLLRKLALPNQDWRSVFRDCLVIDSVQKEVERLLALKVSNAERARRFVEGGFGDRATYYRRLKRSQNTSGQKIPPRVIVPADARCAPVAPVTAGKNTNAQTGKRRKRQPK